MTPRLFLPLYSLHPWGRQVAQLLGKFGQAPLGTADVDMVCD